MAENDSDRSLDGEGSYLNRSIPWDPRHQLETSEYTLEKLGLGKKKEGLDDKDKDVDATLGATMAGSKDKHKESDTERALREENKLLKEKIRALEEEVKKNRI
ncbi:MAG: hypothetical protein WCT37_04415 [Patescibacteria group bacterium]|jgi:hypothetical protein